MIGIRAVYLILHAFRPRLYISPNSVLFDSLFDLIACLDEAERSGMCPSKYNRPCMVCILE